MTYKQLSLDERYQIQTLVKHRRSRADIARLLKRHPSTIGRELARNRYPSTVEVYKATWGQSQARERRQQKAADQRKIRGELKELIEQKLRLSWSPEQIAGRLLAEEGLSISHETIYQHILRDSKGLGFYRYCLRFGGYKHHRFKKSRMAERTRARKNWIEDRPATANKRTEIGHWERDCLLGKRGESALLTMVDRRSRYLRVIHIPRLDTETVSDATCEGLRGLSCKTLTNDNGIEFQRDESLHQTLGIPIYFCNPHSPWERGSVENANGLIRQYFGKGTNFDALPKWGPTAVENTLNFRPRKVLGYKTPYEVFHKRTFRLMKDPSMHFGLEFSSPT